MVLRLRCWKYIQDEQWKVRERREESVETAVRERLVEAESAENTELEAIDEVFSNYAEVFGEV